MASFFFFFPSPFIIPSPNITSLLPILANSPPHISQELIIIIWKWKDELFDVSLEYVFCGQRYVSINFYNYEKFVERGDLTYLTQNTHFNTDLEKSSTREWFYKGFLKTVYFCVNRVKWVFSKSILKWTIQNEKKIDLKDYALYKSTRTMSAQQLNTLKRQKAFAWAKYYEEQNETHERVVNVFTRMSNFSEELPPSGILYTVAPDVGFGSLMVRKRICLCVMWKNIWSILGAIWDTIWKHDWERFGSDLGAIWERVCCVFKCLSLLQDTTRCHWNVWRA